MERQPVKSSAILSAAYDSESRTLELEMSSHAVYAYHEVPASVWAGLLDTERRNASVGHYFMSDIRPAFRFTLVTPRPTEGASHGADSTKQKQVKKVKEAVSRRASKNRAAEPDDGADQA